MKTGVRSLTVAALMTAALSAQTLEQAESLWKAHRYEDANNAFRALTARDPKNPDYKVRWGRLLLDRNNPKEAGDLFKEALQVKPDYPPALLGLALGYADDFDQRAVALAKKIIQTLIEGKVES